MTKMKTVREAFRPNPANYVYRLTQRLLWDAVIDPKVNRIRQAEDEAAYGAMGRATAILSGMREWVGGGLAQLVVVPWDVGARLTKIDYGEQDPDRKMHARTKDSVPRMWIGDLGTFDGALLLTSGVLSIGLAFSMDPAYTDDENQHVKWTEANTVIVKFG